jgi:hypothetical protein
MRNAVKMSARRRGLLGHSMEGAAVPGPRRVRPAWSPGCSPRSGCSTRSLRPMAAATRSLPTSVRPDRVTAGGGPPEGNFRWSAARPNSAMRLAGGWDRPRPHRPGLVSAASQPSIFIQPRYGPGARRDPPGAAIGGTEAHRGHFKASLPTIRVLERGAPDRGQRASADLPAFPPTERASGSCFRFSLHRASTSDRITVDKGSALHPA